MKHQAELVAPTPYTSEEEQRAYISTLRLIATIASNKQMLDLANSLEKDLDQETRDYQTVKGDPCTPSN